MGSLAGYRLRQKAPSRGMSRRDHHREDFTPLARRAESRMRQWRATLTKRERAELGELTRRERVSSEIDRERRERARRTV
jgi:hypothetical protein